MVHEVHDKNGKEIKVGDRVRKVGRAFTGYEGVVWRINFSGISVKVDKPSDDGEKTVGEFGGDSSAAFELISTPAKEESELEALIRKANEGWEAFHALYTKFPGQAEAYYTNNNHRAHDDWQMPDGNHNDSVRFRVKKASFKSFTVGKGWKVELSDDRNSLTIGCQKFEKRAGDGTFSKIFKTLAGDKCSEPFQGFYPGRQGLFHSRTNETLLWNDVDLIIKALEAVGE